MGILKNDKAPGKTDPVVKIESPVKTPEIEQPKVAKFKIGFNHEKMRRSCGKCGCTQLNVSHILDDEKKKKLGLRYTCNDCKTENEGA